jgi:hypothetical protein
MGRHEAEVSRQETETARQEGERWRRQLDNQPAHERQTGGEDSANKKQRRGGVSRGQEAAARREASRQPAGNREANSGGIETFKPDESFFGRYVECGESEPTRCETTTMEEDPRQGRGGLSRRPANSDEGQVLPNSKSSPPSPPLGRGDA